MSDSEDYDQVLDDEYDADADDEHGPASQEQAGGAGDPDSMLPGSADQDRTLEADHAEVKQMQEAVAVCQLASSVAQSAERKGQQAGEASKQARKKVSAAQAKAKKAEAENRAASGALVTAKDAFCQAFVALFGRVLRLPKASIFPITDSAGRVWFMDTKGVVMDGPCKLAWLEASSPKQGGGAMGQASQA